MSNPLEPTLARLEKMLQASENTVFKQMQEIGGLRSDIKLLTQSLEQEKRQVSEWKSKATGLEVIVRELKKEVQP